MSKNIPKLGASQCLGLGSAGHFWSRPALNLTWACWCGDGPAEAGQFTVAMAGTAGLARPSCHVVPILELFILGFFTWKSQMLRAARKHDPMYMHFSSLCLCPVCSHPAVQLWSAWEGIIQGCGYGRSEQIGGQYYIDLCFIIWSKMYRDPDLSLWSLLSLQKQNIIRSLSFRRSDAPASAIPAHASLLPLTEGPLLRFQHCLLPDIFLFRQPCKSLW